MDDVLVVDDVAMLAARLRATARQLHQMGGAEKALEPVVIQAYSQAMPDQPCGSRVEHL